MKIDAICKDSHGNEATVIVDLDYIDITDYDDVKTWCENWLFDQRHRFDILDFSISNYDSLLQEAAPSQEEIIDNQLQGHSLDPLSTEEII